MAKSAKLTICGIRSIQAKVKYSILLLQHSLKKLLYFQKVEGDLGAHLQTSAPQMSQQALETPLNTPHENSPQLKTNNTSAKCPIPDVRQSSEHTAEQNLVRIKYKAVKRNI